MSFRANIRRITSYKADFGVLTSFLGVNVERDQQAGTVKTHQKRAVESLAEKWLPEDSALRKAPPDRPCDEKLQTLTSPMALVTNPDPSDELRKEYWSCLGGAMYVANGSRSDCLHAVGLFSRAAQRPTRELLERLKGTIAFMWATREDYVCEYSAEASRGWPDTERMQRCEP